jgi:hypothetical protein
MMPDVQRCEDLTEKRSLSEKEIELVRWLLENGVEGAENYLSQIDQLRVVSKCGCGCASVNFGLDGMTLDSKSGLEVLSNYCWGTGGKNLRGIFIFARDKKLAGLEVWSIDGLVTPSALPKISELRPSLQYSD